MGGHLERGQRHAPDADVGMSAATIDDGTSRQHLRTRRAQHLDHVRRAAAGGDHIFDHDRRFRRGFGDFGFYDYGCSYGYANYNPYSCYLPAY